MGKWAIESRKKIGIFVQIAYFMKKIIIALPNKVQYEYAVPLVERLEKSSMNLGEL